MVVAAVHGHLSPDEKRWLTEVPTRMAMFDGTVTTLPMHDTPTVQGDGFIMLEIRNQNLTGGMTKMFEILWERATEL